MENSIYTRTTQLLEKNTLHLNSFDKRCHKRPWRLQPLQNYKDPPSLLTPSISEWMKRQPFFKPPTPDPEYLKGLTSRNSHSLRFLQKELKTGGWHVRAALEGRSASQRLGRPRARASGGAGGGSRAGAGGGAGRAPGLASQTAGPPRSCGGAGARGGRGRGPRRRARAPRRARA